jgi:hypothetical protein
MDESGFILGHGHTRSGPAPGSGLALALSSARPLLGLEAGIFIDPVLDADVISSACAVSGLAPLTGLPLGTWDISGCAVVDSSSEFPVPAPDLSDLQCIQARLVPIIISFHRLE